MTGFEMLGAADVPVCADGVCAVPAPSPATAGPEQASVSAEAPPR